MPITKLEKLYFDKLYLYAEFHEMLPLLSDIDDEKILHYIHNNSVNKRQTAINLKRYIDIKKEQRKQFMSNENEILTQYIKRGQE